MKASNSKAVFYLDRRTLDPRIPANDDFNHFEIRNIDDEVARPINMSSTNENVSVTDDSSRILFGTRFTFRNILGAFLGRRRERREAAMLRDLNDALLWDIGICRSEIPHAARKRKDPAIVR